MPKIFCRHKSANIVKGWLISMKFYLVKLKQGHYGLLERVIIRWYRLTCLGGSQSLHTSVTSVFESLHIKGKKGHFTPVTWYWVTEMKWLIWGDLSMKYQMAWNDNWYEVTLCMMCTSMKWLVWCELFSLWYEVTQKMKWRWYAVTANLVITRAVQW